jgi:hypothetical protein
MENFITAFENLSYQFVSFTVGALAVSAFVWGVILGKKA